MTRRSVATLRAAVAALDDVDPRATASRRRFLAELARLERPFDERADPVHVTSSGVLVGPRGTVLHRHKRLGIWLQPGGHVDPGETPEEAVLREVLEETGLPAAHPPAGPELFHVDVHSGGRGHVHLDLRYRLVAGDEDPRPPPGESQDVRWFDWDDALALADPGLVGALRVLKPPAGQA